MKNKFLALGFLLAGTSAMLLSFNSKETASGGITVKVSLEGAPVGEVLVGVATSDENRENSTYISEKETNANGIVNFTGLAAGTYYLDAYISNDDNDYWAEAEVIVAGGIVEASLALEVEAD